MDTMPKIKVENVDIPVVVSTPSNPGGVKPKGLIKAKYGRKAIVPEVVDGGTYAELVGAIGGLLERARERIATTANTTLVETYWNTGRYIVEYEQHGADRAKYGSELLSHLTHDLTTKYGRGYGKSNLVYMRKLYRAFPKGMTLSYQLSWSHYLEILKCSDWRSDFTWPSAFAPTGMCANCGGR